MNLIDVSTKLNTDEKCLAYLEATRWPDGVRCPTCGNNEISRVVRKSATKNKRGQLYQCLESTCKQQFSATSGTLFHDSHLPLHKWFLAVALVTNAKKGLSAKQLQRDLGLGSYRTAWHLYHRIRKAMVDPPTKMKGVVEIDEVYIGGKQRGHKDKLKNKDAVIGIRERGGPLQLVKVEDTKQGTVYEVIRQHVDKDCEAIMTDESRIYSFNLTQYANTPHKRIQHKRKEYVRGNGFIHTNTVESAFSLLRRGIIGNYHSISIKHLQKYLDEFSYRFNRRQIADLFEQTVQRLTGEGALQYKQLTAKT